MCNSIDAMNNCIAKMSTAQAYEDELVVHIPPEQSRLLPSRGMTLVEGTLDEVYVLLVLEPDGQGGHWPAFSRTIVHTIKPQVGDDLRLPVGSERLQQQREVS